jgi:hypothetical protein
MRLTTIIAAAAVLAACAVPQVKQVPAPQPLALPADGNSNTIDLSTVTVKLPYDETKMRVQHGWLCEFGKEITLPNDRLPMSRRDVEEAFSRALGPLNYKFPKAPESVFEASSVNGPQLLIGATVIRREASLCYQFSGSPTLSFGNISSAKGSAYLQITWEIFSVAERKVILRKTTEGTYMTDETIDDGEKITTLNAFKASLLSLAADPKFKELVLRKEPLPPLKEKSNSLPA